MTVAASRPCLAEVKCHNYQLKVQLYFNGRDFTNLCIVAMAVVQIAYSINLCPVATLYKQYRFQKMSHRCGCIKIKDHSESSH